MTPTLIECASGIEHVVVYARGAVVTRRVTLPAALPDGPVDLSIPGVTALADAGSLRAACEGEREVTALSGRLVLPAAKAELGALAEKVRALSLEQQRIEAELRSAAALRRALAAARLDPALSRWAKNLDPSARFADAAALSQMIDAELRRLDGALVTLGEALEDNRRSREAAQIALAQGTPDEIAGALRPSLDVRLRLAAGGAVAALSVSYVVDAARWWPVYAARFTEAATKVTLALDAVVCQLSDEDWSRVRLSLSTAHLAQDARLPELASLRFGRAQPPPARGYRPPPEGLDALFEGYDRAVAQHPSPAAVTRAPPPRPMPPPAPLSSTIAVEKAALIEELEAEDMPAEMPKAEMARPAAKPAPGFGGAPPAPQGMIAPARAKKSRAMLGRASAAADLDDSAMYAARSMDEGGVGGGGGAPVDLPPAAIEPSEGFLDFDALEIADPADHARRGRLVRAAGSGGVRRRRIKDLIAPPRARDPLDERGRFDHRYDAGGAADVPASGRPHRVTVATADTHASARFTVVPRETTDVFREAEIKNPFDAPLLGGPVDVFLDGALATTSDLAFVDRSGSMRIGLGVEDRLRVARNARVEESSAGLLGGSLVVDHNVTVDLSSSLGHPATVDVLERVPVTDDKDVEIKVTYSRPEHEKYTQADRGAPVRRGARFTVTVPPGDKARIEYGYRVTLPAKNEIVGGNRRE